ncbi:MAG: hypothetical protein LBJ14_05510 [Desulfarculales bacterium]|jgi:hypothetical protein|nr:hypothetical protein [Desulfarculales bacterium]
MAKKVNVEVNEEIFPPEVLPESTGGETEPPLVSPPTNTSDQDGGEAQPFSDSPPPPAPGAGGAEASPPSPALDLQEIEALAKALGVVSWELAGLRTAKGWAPGKQVSQAEFKTALEAYRKRPSGGGRLGSAS